jgi:hypothetical protein
VESFSYLVGLVSIVIGIALTEVAAGVDRSLRAPPVRHDPLVIGSAVLVTLMLVSVWFDFWAVRRVTSLFSFPFFLLVFVQLLLLYLLAAACLPKRDTEPATAPAAGFYDANRRYFWRLYTLYQIVYAGIWIVFQMQKGVEPLQMVARSWEILVPLFLGAALSLIPNRIVQGLGIASLIGILLFGYWGYRIG